MTYRDQADQRHPGRWPWTRSRNKKNSDSRLGPTLILIHGQPGVGKSAIARELASRIAHDFPDGQLYANLGSGGAARRPGEILLDFLEDLGENPSARARADNLAKIFRSVTAGRRVLIVLDAARDPQQVKSILPNGEGCTVIITSRRSLAPDVASASHQLDVPSTDDAMQILSAFAASNAQFDPEHAIEVVEICGRLPAALRSASEQKLRDNQSWQQLATEFRPASSRLERLSSGGRDIGERIGSEYERLPDRERCAFRFLTLIDTPTFVPWVLTPLLQIEVSEAENIMAQLARAQLIETAGPDTDFRVDVSFGLPRYRFHALFKLYAAARLAEEDDERDILSARGRLDDAVLEASAKVISVLEPEFQMPDETSSGLAYISPASPWPMQVAESVEQWIGAEYRCLSRAVVIAHRRGEWELCWRIAAYLGGAVPQHVDMEECLRVFEDATKAADLCGEPAARIRVTLAFCSFLVAVERYGTAFTMLDSLISEREMHAVDLPGTEIARPAEATARRLKAEAWLQLGAYRSAETAIDQARRSAETIASDSELKLLDMLTSELAAVTGPSTLTTPHSTRQPQDWDSSLWYRDRLRGAESARRRRDWSEAEHELREALKFNYGDARRAASLRYRLGRLFLEQWSCSARRLMQGELVNRAVAYAAAAVYSFMAMQDALGAARARCLLARALTASGALESADRECDRADAELRRLTAEPDEVIAALRARWQYARGELLLQQARYPDSRRALVAAIGYFVDQNDYWSELYAHMILGRVERAAGNVLAANAAHWRAASAFWECKDATGLKAALHELADTADAMAHHESGTELRRYAQGVNFNGATSADLERAVTTRHRRQRVMRKRN
jgi:hypothetical protein